MPRKKSESIVYSGYYVREPVGGFFWQAAHYLMGLRALGYDPWYYEDSGWRDAPRDYRAGLAAAGRFFSDIGFGERWVFVDLQRGEEHGPGAGRGRTLLEQAAALISYGWVNRLPAERGGGKLNILIDSDAAYTQLRLANGDRILRDILDRQALLFTLSENVGTPRAAVPTGGFTWRATRNPVHIPWWRSTGPPGRDYTTVGTWNDEGRDIVYKGETYLWRKRSEWLKILDLPAKTGCRFEMAMDAAKIPGDREILESRGWRVRDPVPISLSPQRYREYLRGSRGEFSVSKDLYVRTRSGWFSDRSPCYLAAGRPVVLQDTGFGDGLPLGPGLHAFSDLEGAAEAIQQIERDYRRAGAHAAAVAREFFAAEKVVAALLEPAGL